ncbi:MAG: Membrane proteins related to metalloendopeptidases [uncultured Sulfurovum sp.]|uniref:Membrane proteins related to metalloendopeptidases n=1 Tax=uncultured Sulfurovum sp. TaxID=269237 RepID=A0A6S6S1Q7_9BACT|nr:MAG: Membrane proteins related to metalloendopeptidases [uncultured Sulfurovum sp.]
MPIKSLLILLTLLLFTQNITAKEYKWSNKLTFLGFLKKHGIPQKVYYNMHKEDKELIQEIRAGQSYSINRKKGKIDTINIPVSDELMLQLKNSKKGYGYKYVEIPYQLIERTISIKMKHGFKKDLYKATKTWYYGKELEEVYSKSIPFHKMRKGDRIILFYTQRYRNNKPYTSPQIDACLIEIKGKPFYGFLMDNEKYYDSLGTQYKRTYTTRFIRPVPNMKRISSRFTHRRYHPIHKRYRPHLGIDYAARSGSRIVASSKGRVVYKGWKGGYGRTIEIQHANGLKTLYAHMRGYAKGVNRGTYVGQGKTIGYVGTSGKSTGPHLHFGLYKKGRAVNPARYVKKQSAKVVKIKGKAYQRLRKLVRHYRPQFQETKARKSSIIKKESSKCLNCFKKLPPRK